MNFRYKQNAYPVPFESLQQKRKQKKSKQKQTQAHKHKKQMSRLVNDRIIR